VIDFRYHLVSIVAIFLALTVGIFLGSTVLETAFYKSAEETTAQLRQTNNDLRSQLATLQAREDGGNSLITAHTGELVRERLTGERVVLVEAPGAPAALRDSIENLVTEAGATYSGRVSLTDKFLAADQAAVIDGLAVNTAPPGTKFADGATPYDKAAVVLAGAIVTKDRSQAGRPNPATASALDAFRSGGYINLGGTPAQRSTLAIVVAPVQAYEGETAETQNAAVVSVAAGLDAADLGTVVTGTATASATGGLIAALHDAGEAAANVSSVDAVDMPAGRVVLVYALREQLAGRAGAYGLGDDSTAFEPAATASESPPARSG
jgi:hypothetical protein